MDPVFSPFRPDFLQNPYPELEHLNRERPIFYSTELQSLIVTRMDQVLEIFKNPDVFSLAHVQDPVFPLADRASEILAARDFDRSR